MRFLNAALIIITLSLLSGCGGTGNDSAVPRRTAYPRIVPYDSAYTAVSDLPIPIYVNKDATIERDNREEGTIWINVRYPRYRATVYCTLTPVDANTVEAVLDNRAERIHRNLGASIPEVEDYTNAGGYYANLVVSPGAVTTPVQFLSVNEQSPKWVVSGAAFFDDASVITAADSITPMVEVMTRDIRVMLDSIR